MNFDTLPNFDALPLSSKDPPYSAWGLWKNPELGALNHLSDANVLEAARDEIKTGTRVCLKSARTDRIRSTV
jgi:hypothetical protein